MLPRSVIRETDRVSSGIGSVRSLPGPIATGAVRGTVHCGPVGRVDAAETGAADPADAVDGGTASGPPVLPALRLPGPCPAQAVPKVPGRGGRGAGTVYSRGMEDR